MSGARLYVEQDLAAGATVALAAERAHYLLHVLRLAGGDGVLLFNGRDGEWRARVASARKGRCTLVTDDLRRPQTPGPDLWLLFAPLKRHAIDLLAQKATELGVSRLVPVGTERTNAGRVNGDRLKLIAIEAAEQCARLDVPDVAPLRALDAVLGTWPGERQLIACVEPGEGREAVRPIGQALAGLTSGPAALLVGPEGGFTPRELDGLGKLPSVTPVRLGPRFLRAETAALAALAVWQASLGDWRDPPRN
ncbi:MAG: 16S rRNA (uracil(1498)-N(3))-methyltransferase [Alphaproteobacteria bacterium]|nr:16S rRNA (uracil(1498)-N(3))-methyltransferase [Alphaproteobacteria bacterium]